MITLAKYNIYKLIKRNEPELLKKLKKVGLRKLETKIINDYELSFYMSTEPEDIKIWWVDLFKDFLGDMDKTFNKAYFGILLISSDNLLYGISLGKTHFYLKEFCDQDFGIDLAERIIDIDNLIMKNSKLYGGKRKNAIVTYHSDSGLEYSSGESVHLLKGKSDNAKLWGDIIIFGHSVKFNLDILPLELPQLIERIEQQLKKTSKIKLPRVEEIRDKKEISRLDDKLIKTLMGSFRNAALGMDETSLSGVEFIFLDKNRYEYMWKRKKKMGDLTKESLKLFIEENEIDLITEFNNIKVKVSDEYSKGFTNTLKFFLDYIDHENFCLIGGKWHKFNQSYIEFIKREVDAIEKETSPNFSKSEYKSALLTNGQKPKYQEDYFNRKMQETEGYLLLDRQNIQIDKFTIEIADLYKNETLFCVKLGEPQKLSYAIDQATATLRLIQKNELENSKIGDGKIKPKSLCLWLLLDRRTQIKNLSEINSLIFQMKLVEWAKETKNAGLRPFIRFGYIED